MESVSHHIWVEVLIEDLLEKWHNLTLLEHTRGTAFGANILMITAIKSVSHFVWSEVLIEGLLANGHNITFIGHHETKIKSKNYTLYRITGFDEIYEDIDLESQQQASTISGLLLLWDFMLLSSERHLKSDVLTLLLEYPKDKFDLIIVDVVCGQEFYPLIEYFGSPSVIAISPFGLPPYILDTMGSHFYFYYPHFRTEYTDDMTFLQRIINTFLYITEYFLKWHYMPNIYKMAQAVYGPNITSFDQMEKKIELVLANYDPILDFAQPLSPNIIPVGGMHVKRPENLPNDLQEILDKVNDGVIYFSFGTLVKPSWLSEETKRIFLNVFSKLNQTILWKYSANDLKNIPKNVIIRKWYPQNKLLAHRNVKLFITHGGGLSSHETMFHAVPVVVIPFFADQYANAAKLVGKGIGKKICIGDLTEDVFYRTISEVIDNPVYKQNVQKISRMFRDQKETPLERATFWVENILRNKDFRHLSTRARDMTLFQRENLDVYGIILFFILVVLILFVVIMRQIVSRFALKKRYKIKQN